jgi:hypothetical protein
LPKDANVADPGGTFREAGCSFGSVGPSTVPASHFASFSDPSFSDVLPAFLITIS